MASAFAKPHLDHVLALLVIDLRQRIDAAQPSPPHAARDAVIEAMLAFGNSVGAGLSHGAHDREPQGRCLSDFVALLCQNFLTEAACPDPV